MKKTPTHPALPEELAVNPTLVAAARETFELGSLLGAAMMAGVTENFARTARIRAFEKAKESK
jgi:hypothetical protein